VRLELKSGIVPVAIDRRTGAPTFGRMEQPLPTVADYERADELLAALRVSGSELPVEVYDNGVRHAYVMLVSPEAVAGVRPDTAALGQLGDIGANAFAGSGTRYKTRMFGTGLGVSEDPATGSAAGPLAVHLARHGRIPWGTEIEISQGVEIGRPSRLFARAVGSADRLERVEVGGSAVVVARGEFLL
jgi:trans-2,3-dihydro-3-hydroxyanthranilate isomerase